MRYREYFFSIHPLIPIQSERILFITHVLFVQGTLSNQLLTVPFLTVSWLQILFDILPLRLVPPLVFGGIVYGLVGLVPTVAEFWKFILTLVLFNLTTASVVLWLSIAFASVSVASLVGTLIMLFKFVDIFPLFMWM